jgi:hypothetical protein
VFEYHEEHMPEKRERTITACKRGEERPSNEGLANRTPAERVAMVWPLTKTAWTFEEAGERSRDEDGHANENETPRAEQRLQRGLIYLRPTWKLRTCSSPPNRAARFSATRRHSVAREVTPDENPSGPSQT